MKGVNKRCSFCNNEYVYYLSGIPYGREEHNNPHLCQACDEIISNGIKTCDNIEFGYYPIDISEDMLSAFSSMVYVNKDTLFNTYSYIYGKLGCEYEKYVYNGYTYMKEDNCGDIQYTCEGYKDKDTGCIMYKKTSQRSGVYGVINGNKHMGEIESGEGLSAPMGIIIYNDML